MQSVARLSVKGSLGRDSMLTSPGKGQRQHILQEGLSQGSCRQRLRDLIYKMGQCFNLNDGGGNLH